MSRTIMASLALAALCFCSALAVVFSKHLTREAYAEISENRTLINELDVQWSQLQIEESTFSAYGLIERQARERLKMSFPGLEGSVMIVR